MIFDTANLIKKIANKEYTIHEFAKEWGATIIVLWVLKFATSGVSVTAGYNFMYNVFFTLIESATWSITFTILFLGLIELLNMYFLSKAFKFGFHGKFIACGVLVMVALGTFGLSSYISIQGLRQFTSTKVDNTENIVNNYSVLLENLETEHNGIVADFKAEIITIKNNPEGWQNGKRAVLTSEQQANIRNINASIAKENDRYFTERTALMEAKERELTNNKTEATDTSDEYMWYVGVIMFLQLACNGGLMFFYSRIYNENEREKVITDAVTDIRDSVLSRAVNSIIEALNNVGSRLVGGFGLAKEYQFADLQAQPILSNEPSVSATIPPIATATSATRPRTSPPLQTPQKPIGFAVGDTDTATPTAHGHYGPVVEGNTDTQEHGQTAVSEHGRQVVKVCKFCNKEFTPKAWNQVFCCPEHKDKYWNNNGLDIEKIKLKNKKKSK